LVEETKTGSARARANETTKSTRQDTAGDLVGVTSIDSLVAARELSLVTALGLGLIDGHVIRDREANTRLSNIFAVVRSLTRRTQVGKSDHRGGEGEDNS
jgi:hypothetical protein